MEDSRVFRLYITNFDNDAFADGETHQEIARILRAAADKIERQSVNFFPETLHDINGNNVGHYALKTAQQWKDR